ncbi:MAG: hypothetical protein ACRDZ8_11440 [Acidimicrobiales bacterium]
MAAASGTDVDWTTTAPPGLDSTGTAWRRPESAVGTAVGPPEPTVGAAVGTAVGPPEPTVGSARRNTVVPVVPVVPVTVVTAVPVAPVVPVVPVVVAVELAMRAGVPGC